jgi:hypothetical protein
MLQIAEHPAFTAINAFRIGHDRLANAYVINDDIGIYLKYATRPYGTWTEYKFTFNREHLVELDELGGKRDRTYVALVCWRHREVCCLRRKQLLSMIELRRKALGSDEDAYTVYVQAPQSAKFRAYISPPGQKGKMLGTLRIARNAFPGCVFDKSGKLSLVS